MLNPVPLVPFVPYPLKSINTLDALFTSFPTSVRLRSRDNTFILFKWDKRDNGSPEFLIFWVPQDHLVCNNNSPVSATWNPGIGAFRHPIQSSVSGMPGRTEDRRVRNLKIAQVPNHHSGRDAPVEV